jgi:hypothetical protein
MVRHIIGRNVSRDLMLHPVKWLNGEICDWLNHAGYNLIRYLILSYVSKDVTSHLVSVSVDLMNIPWNLSVVLIPQQVKCLIGAKQHWVECLRGNKPHSVKCLIEYNVHSLLRYRDETCIYVVFKPG